MTFDLINIALAVAPSIDDVEQEILELKRAFPELSQDKLVKKFCSRIVTKYTSAGIVTALPGAIPGLGTAVQIGTEVGTVTTDLALMLRWTATMCIGIGLIYNKDMRMGFNQDFIRVLGLWCGAIKVMKEATKRVASKVAVVQFNRHLSATVLKKINQKVGTTILTKWGTKRGGIAFGKLIPFGVGAVVSGGFNYYTMNAFRKAALLHYKDQYDSEFIIVE